MPDKKDNSLTVLNKELKEPTICIHCNRPIYRDKGQQDNFLASDGKWHHVRGYPFACKAADPLPASESAGPTITDEAEAVRVGRNATGANACKDQTAISERAADPAPGPTCPYMENYKVNPHGCYLSNDTDDGPSPNCWVVHGEGCPRYIPPRKAAPEPGGSEALTVEECARQIVTRVFNHTAAEWPATVALIESFVRRVSAQAALGSGPRLDAHIEQAAENYKSIAEAEIKRRQDAERELHEARTERNASIAVRAAQAQTVRELQSELEKVKAELHLSQRDAMRIGTAYTTSESLNRELREGLRRLCDKLRQIHADDRYQRVCNWL